MRVYEARDSRDRHPIEAGGDRRTIPLSEDLEFGARTGADEERTHFAFGVGEEWGLRARVPAGRHTGEQVEITAVGEDARVHQADSAARASPFSRALRAGDLLGRVAAGLYVSLPAEDAPATACSQIEGWPLILT